MGNNVKYIAIGLIVGILTAAYSAWIAVFMFGVQLDASQVAAGAGLRWVLLVLYYTVGIYILGRIADRVMKDRDTRKGRR